jgi:2-keto-4-pentenoate hydratase
MLFRTANSDLRTATSMQKDAIHAAAALLWRCWTGATRVPELPAGIRPLTRADGYAIQSEVVRLFQQPVAGWKIAATSLAGQRHIGVDGPLVGSLMANRLLHSGASVPLEGNHMRVGEAEFAFRFARDLLPRPTSYTVDEVLDAVSAMHPTIEIPDSRFDDFARVGAPQLIADNACACWLVVGSAAAGWRDVDLSTHTVTGFLDGQPVVEGIGANVLEDPRTALTWMVNERCTFGDGIKAGDLVTTGTCIAPIALAPGRHFRADFGVLGSLEVGIE